MVERVRVSDPTGFGKVAVVMGGWSAEREISLKSGNAVLAGLRRGGVDAHGIDAGRDVQQVLAAGGFDRVFIVLHGRGGEDGQIQGALDLMGLPYTGSGVLASAIGMDKWRSKLVWGACGLPVPEYEFLDEGSDLPAVVARLGLPLFVKPGNEGSSIGVTKVKAVDELKTAYLEARRYDAQVLAERFIGGGEYTVTLLNGVALPAIKIEPAREFYDYQAKYFADDTAYRCPCGLAPELEQRMQQLALAAFAATGGRGWGRIDFLLDEQGEAYLLEANTVPGMTDHSLVPMAAKTAGIDFDRLVWEILEGSMDIEGTN